VKETYRERRNGKFQTKTYLETKHTYKRERNTQVKKKKATLNQKKNTASTSNGRHVNRSWCTLLNEIKVLA
jgi:hypothetical protein